MHRDPVTLRLRMLVCILLAPAPAAAWSGDVPLAVAAGDQGVTWSDKPGVAAIADSLGGSIHAWEDEAGDVRMQRLSPDGEPLWPAAGIAPAAGDRPQASPRLAPDGAGGAIVVWHEPTTAVCLADPIRPCGLYAQHVGADGLTVWGAGGVPVTTAADLRGSFAVAGGPGGGACVVWTQGFSRGRVLAQRLSAGGAPLWAAGGIDVGPLWYLEPRAIPDGAGGWIVAWNGVLGDDPYTQTAALTVQRLDADGSLPWGADGVVAGSGSRRFGVVSDGAGGAIVAFADYVAPSFSVFAQRVDASGAVLWTPGGVTVTAEPTYQLDPDLASDGAGGAIVAWHDERNQLWDADVYAQRIAADGSRLWAPEGVAVTQAAGNQDFVRIVGDGAGGAILGWSDERDQGLAGMDLYGQRLDAAGQVLWAPDGSPVSAGPGNQGVHYGSAYRPSFELAAVAPGEVVAVWPDGRDGTCLAYNHTECDVYARRMGPAAVPVLPGLAWPALAALLAAAGFAGRRRG